VKEKLIKFEYSDWLKDVKLQIKNAQIKATISVNSQLIMLYWDLGRQILEKQENAKWGSNFLDQLSKDLQNEFPDMKGLSATNLKYCKYFYSFYTINYTKAIIRQQVVDEMQSTDNQSNIIRQQPVDELYLKKITSIPWGHHILILNKIKEIDKAMFYIEQTIENNWSRAVLEYQIDTKLYKRQGKAATNFKFTLPEADSDLANALMKSEYNFEFLQMSDKVKENDL
jgi:predicted nuclease of restriction endonuclease-like (RecB) superfamily